MKFCIYISILQYVEYSWLIQSSANQLNRFIWKYNAVHIAVYLIYAILCVQNYYWFSIKWSL